MTTFRHPLGVNEYKRLTGSGALGAVATFEAIGERPDGTIVTVGGPAEAVEDAADLFREDGARIVGVIAAFTTLDDRQAYRTAQARDEVLLVDLVGAAFLARLKTAESWRALVGTDSIDLVMNDCYWIHAGLQ